ncbi:MAG: VCP-like ATPase [Methanosaeta sp. PtaU1.Bin060]|jgi:SpoVK/Ycf46/Vps4 family AAA+-type ATPase|nr:MAG: VCP-like ATPase [Methanosaeta sp. PtaU1.Bin060]
MGLETGSDKCGAMEVAELLLTADIYNRSENLTEDDLPPRIRKHYFDSETRSVKRPIYVTASDVQQICGIQNVKGAIKDLPFVGFEEFGSQLRLTVFDLGAKWFANQKDLARIKSNPALAYFYENYNSLDVSYADSRSSNRPLLADREWLDARIKELCRDQKESEDLLKLVYIKAPEDVRDSIEGLVLTAEQKAEIEKIEKALMNRDYLRKIGLYEIGKLLFVGPPGTGKTSTARSLSSWFSLPLVEVRLSMITSQYLGETSKNIDKVFELAKKISPCILLIDEFDFVAKTRTSDEHGAIKRAVNTLLKAIDEISLVEHGVLLLAATNHPQLLDYAAWRRFDRVLGFPLPDSEMRRRILDKVLSRIDADVDTRELAALTDGYSGSDLRLVVREAVLNALVEDRRRLAQDDLLKAIDDFGRRMSEYRRSTNT